MDVKGEVLITSKQKQVKKWNQTFLKPKFFSRVKFKKLGFSAPLNIIEITKKIFAFHSSISVNITCILKI